MIAEQDEGGQSGGGDADSVRGVTRAKEKLILTGTLKEPAKTAASLLPVRFREELQLPYDVLLGRGSFLDLLASCTGEEPVHGRLLPRMRFFRAGRNGILL